MWVPVIQRTYLIFIGDNSFALSPLPCYPIAITRHMEPHDDTRRDVTEGQEQFFAPTSTYVTLEEAVLLFENAGVFRSTRTLSRYCQQDVLDCTKEETPSGAMRYLATKESVSNRILEIQQIGASGHVRSRPDMAGHDASRPDMSRHDETGIKALEERVEELEQQKEQLREENTDLKIDVGTKGAVLKQTLENYNHFMQERDTLLKHIGSLETQVRQIAPPQDAPSTTFEKNEHAQNSYAAADREAPGEPIPNSAGKAPEFVYNE